MNESEAEIDRDQTWFEALPNCEWGSLILSYLEN